MDVEAVRAFVLVAELRSFTRAAEVLGATQSAVSLRLRRLEAQLGRRLLERTPRQVSLSADGQHFLAPARALVGADERATAAFETGQRRLSLGISQLLVGAGLPALLRRLHQQDPGLQLCLRVDGSNALLSAFAQGTLHAVLVLRGDERSKRAQMAFHERFAWFAVAGWQQQAGAPLPLATQGEACRVRASAVQALDAAGVPWQEVFIGQGAALLGAAAAGGWAIAPLARRAAPAGTVDVGPALRLPAIPPQPVVLHAALRDPRSRHFLRVLTLAFRGAD